MSWDKRDFKKRAEKIERDKNGPPKAVIDELKAWIARPRAEHEECRSRSRAQGMSIVAVILALSPESTKLSDSQHAQALEYLSLQLAVRDRQEIVRVLCQRNPDILTTAVRSGVDTYTPIIRQVHQAVNLSDTVWDFERFVTDLLKISRGSGAKGQEVPPGVEDFVDLLHRHQSSTHKFLHQVFKNGKELTSWWREYAHGAVAHFRNDAQAPASDSVIPNSMVNGGIRDGLDAAFAELSADDQRQIQIELDAHHQYITDLHAASAARISAVIRRTHSTPFGPGAYLARWQQLLDNTPITPAQEHGPLRYGTSRSVKEESTDDVDGQSGGSKTSGVDTAVAERLPAAPISTTTVKLLSGKFRALLSSPA